MPLCLTALQFAQIQDHAERTYPEECCGILLGRIERAGSSGNESASIVTPTDVTSTDVTPTDVPSTDRRTVVQVIETRNAWNAEAAELLTDLIQPSRHGSSQHPEAAKRDRYWIDPQDLLQAQKQARDRGLQIIGFYHSHPDHLAIPSETDRQLAWADYSYLIGSLQQGKGVEWRSWRLDEAGRFEGEGVEMGE